MDKKSENKAQKMTSGTSSSKGSEKGMNSMNRTEFAQEYNLNTDKQSKNCNSNKANKSGNKNK